MDKAKLFFLRDGSATLSRVLVGAVLGILIGSGAGIMTIGAVVAGLVGLTALSQMSIENAKEQMLTNLYRDEIAATLGKSPDQVRVSDLGPMSQTPDEGGRGSYVIKAGLDDYKRTRNFHILSQAVTGILLTAGLAVASLGLVVQPQIAAVVLAGAASLIYNELFNAVRTGGELLYDVKKGTITLDIRAISDQIGLGGRISSTRVFGVYVKANQKLADAIKKRFGDDYEALNITTKRELVRDFDETYNLYQVTQDINLGHTNPTELGFLAYGQHSGVARRTEALVPFQRIEEEPQEICGEEKGHIVCREAPAELHPNEMLHSERVREDRLKNQIRTLQ